MRARPHPARANTVGSLSCIRRRRFSGVARSWRESGAVLSGSLSLRLPHLALAVRTYVAGGGATACHPALVPWSLPTAPRTPPLFAPSEHGHGGFFLPP